MSTAAVDPVAPPPAAGRSLAEGARYLAASIAALALDAALLAFAATVLAWPAWLAGALGYFAGLVLIYLLSTRWVFAHRSVRDRRAEFVLFASIGLATLVLNSAVLTAAVALGLALPIGKAISAGIGFVANFALRRLCLFTPRSRAASRA